MADEFKIYKKGTKYAIYRGEHLIIVTEQLQIVRKYLKLNEMNNAVDTVSQ